MQTFNNAPRRLKLYEDSILRQFIFCRKCVINLTSVLYELFVDVVISQQTNEQNVL